MDFDIHELKGAGDLAEGLANSFFVLVEDFASTGTLDSKDLATLRSDFDEFAELVNEILG
ncbi:hypothetical protein ACFY00_33090 [Kitasatospora sp. NPDC001540]|uniref:hypothetical protein n=1 Tax=Kitasatospora sp. NPDC001540 TaxID=3364014 RepID=UPI0036B5A5FC